MSKEFKKYLSLVKFSHTIFAMPFAVAGYFLGEMHNSGETNYKILAFVVLCMIFARNAAMGFNRYIDREIDKKNPRTKNREIPSGAIKVKSALWFVIINAALFVATTWFINNLTFLLSPVALLVILGYSLTKRFTAICHLILGLGLSLAPIGAYLAVTAEFQLIPILLSLIVLSWVAGFDIIYSLQDEEFDSKEKLYSIPSYFGKKKARLFSIFLHSITAAITLYIGDYAKFEEYYFIGAFSFIAFLIYQHIMVKTNDLSNINLKYMSINGVSSLIFGIFMVLEFV
ncbi:MAG: 4-hydroxybenzoate octaprenyltransferase [Bacteroidales bacterium]|nr:4-hydroxybenzoate octaprenyltransferase [Bacteroidales bacterium]